jgi:hypothetical protein
MAKAAKEESTALDTAVKYNSVSAELAEELALDAGAGTSSSADDNIVPFIVLLQDMSPEVKKRDPEYVQGAEVGYFLNKATKKLFAPDEDTARATGLPVLEFQHCHFDRCIVEWVPRVEGGGFVARHELNGSPEQTMSKLGGRLVQDQQDPNKKVWKTPNGHDLIDTRYHYGYAIPTYLNEDPSEQPTPAVLAFSSTGHTASREWMTLMNNFKVRTKMGQLVTAPSWSKKYRIRSKARTNVKGDFFVVAVDDAGIIEDSGMRAMGKALNAAATSGSVRAAADGTTGAEAETPI